MFWNWINSVVGVLPPFLFIRLRYSGWLANADHFFFWNGNAPGNLILWPLIIRVSFCKQRHLQTYKQVLWFGCKPITRRRQADIPIQLSLCSRRAWNTKALGVKCSGPQRGGGSVVTGSHGHSPSSKEFLKAKSQALIGINHQMCPRLCPNGIL